MADVDTKDNSAEARIQDLIRERNQARSDLQEAKAEIITLNEAATASKTTVEQAVASARGEMQAKIDELEAANRKSSYRELLLGDKIPVDQLDEIIDYLSFSYEKIQPEEGKEKPEFKDWYSVARKQNKVLRAAMKESTRKAVDADEIETDNETPDTKVETKTATKTVIPPKPLTQDRKPGDMNKDVDISKLKLGSAEWMAAKEKLKRQIFANGRV